MPQLTELSAVQLADLIRRGATSSRTVVNAHIDCLIRSGPRLNAVVAERFELARQEADLADAAVERARSSGEPSLAKPLLGVPFTVKETIELEGMPTSAGVIARRAHRASRSAPAVQRLIDAGAIPLAVTNTSELTLWIESDNPLYGRTNNPYDLRRTAGGSSGGEGASVGSGGAPFGLASDIAGSIRIPALFCGVFGHKPSAGLVPNTGLWPPSTGSAGQLLGTGPLTRCAEDLMPLLRVIAGPDGEDPNVTARELGDPNAVDLAGLTVTTVESAALRPMSRGIRDARERAVGALVALGAKSRRIALPTWRKAVLPYLTTLQAASAAEDAMTTAQLLVESGESPPTWRSISRGRRRHSIPTRIALAAEMLPDDADSARRQKLLDAGSKLAEQLREAIGDGVLIHPAHPRVAPRHRTTVGRPWLMTPAAVFNLAGVPVTEVPLGLSASGLPVGVQVAAAAGCDHVSIAVALALEDIFGGWVPPPRAASRNEKGTRAGPLP